ncbi:MAG: DUF2145 domain-containing protein [Maricaulis sp.]|nr:DUF2145 domain-containing protein [Maricaulis sp.]
MFRSVACLLMVIGLASCSGNRTDTDGQPSDTFALQDAADFSKQIERELATRGAYVAMVFRSGATQAALPDEIDYSHGSFWVYTPIETDDGRTLYGYAVYNLYHGIEDQTQSDLVQDWPLDFTRADDTGTVGIIIPNAAMQARILDVLASDDYYELHQSQYALMSSPTDLRFQNAPEFILDVVASAAWKTTDRDQIKVNIDAYFDETTIEIGGFGKFLAPIQDVRNHLQDQPGMIHTSSFASIAQFMENFDLSDESFELVSDVLPVEVDTGDTASEEDNQAQIQTLRRE